MSQFIDYGKVFTNLALIFDVFSIRNENFFNDFSSSFNKTLSGDDVKLLSYKGKNFKNNNQD